jgi:pimeloyl-ACP methyl ester carboxylesterase
MPHATIHGHDLFYERSGSGEPLLLIMGMSGTHLSWGEPFLDGLRREFEVCIYDHRGVGHSSATEPGFTIADLADDAAGLLDALGWDTAHVVGISMGGMIAQELALRHPERLRTLTLGCTYPGGAGSALASQETMGKLMQGLNSGDPEQAVRASWEVNVSPAFSADDAAFAAFRGAALELPVALEVIMAQAQAVMGHDASGRLADISAPTLVIHGTADEMLPVANAAVIAEKIPDSRLEIFDGVGHIFFQERPGDSVRLIADHAREAGRV